MDFDTQHYDATECSDQISPDDIDYDSQMEDERLFLEKLIGSYESLMQDLVEPIEKRIVNKTMRVLQSYKRDSGMMTSGDDSGLLNVWEEFCAQVQGEQSFFYDAYLDVIEGEIGDILKNCSEEEKIILWTQTQDYFDFCSDGAQDVSDLKYDMFKSVYSEEAICTYIRESVEAKAGDYHNKRIDEYNTPIWDEYII